MTKENKIRKYYSEAFTYIKNSRYYIYISTLIFIFSAIFAFLYPDVFSIFDEELRKLVDKTRDMSVPGLIAFIFFNNLKISFIAIVSGILFGIIPIIMVLANGAVLGYVFARIYELTGVGEFWRILPHGIFELPAVFISIGLGIKLGMFIFSENLFKDIKRRFLLSMKVFLFVILPLLIIASLIEGMFIFFYK
ncbi:MAG: stage II sporulation protein M [Nanoarchaeota archaeon]